MFGLRKRKEQPAVQSSSPVGPLRCSFCNKTSDEGRKLIAGPMVFICDECVRVCDDILADSVRDEAAARDAADAVRADQALRGELLLQTRQLTDALSALLRELVDGSGREAAWVLNPQDGGLLKALDELSAAAASRPALGGGPSIAAHVDHLRDGLELMNRWSRGEDPFTDADYSASWHRLTVTDQEWAKLRDQLRAGAHAWLAVVSEPRVLSPVELTGMIASIVHLAYHLGAIRQVDRSIRGPIAVD